MTEQLTVFIFYGKMIGFVELMEKFTSKDISYGFADVEIKPIDDYTIEFKLKQLNIFPFILTQPVIKLRWLALERVTALKV